MKAAYIMGCTQGLLAHRLLIWTVLMVESWGQNQWLKKPKDTVAQRGDNVTFECQPADNSTSITWTKGVNVIFGNGVAFNPSLTRFSLASSFAVSITGVQDEDDDTYGCSVPNYGTVSARLTVAVLPGSPSLTISHLGDFFREGQTVNLTCQSSGGRPPPSVLWMKNGVQLSSPSPDVTQVSNVSRSSLTITLSHSDHAANYTCFVYNLLNEKHPFIASRIFNVQYSPIITFDPFGPYTVRAGQPVTVTCVADANPPVTNMTWQNDGQVLSSMQGALRFAPVTRQDSGNYTCFASNSLSNAAPSHASVYINVVYSPNVTVPASLTVQEWSSATLNCSVDANPEPLEVRWEKVNGDGSRVQMSKSQFLFIANVSRADQGNYSCQATSRLTIFSAEGPTTEIVDSSALTMLFVKYPPGPASISPISDVRVNQSLHINCSANPEGYPPATFRWQKNDLLLSEGAAFVIKELSLSDTGNYTCTPSNSEGRGTSASVAVSVNEPPTFVTKLSENVTVAVNSSQVFNLTCKARGHPEPKILWLKDGTILEDTSEFYGIDVSVVQVDTYSSEVTSVLTFAGSGREQLPNGARGHLGVQDLGNYTCSVTSPAGFDSTNSTVTLWVQFGPVQRSFTHKVAVNVSQPANLTCQVQAYPAPAFAWYRNGQQLTVNSSSSLAVTEFPVPDFVSTYASCLQIRQLQPGDFGIYQCLAVNFMGRTTQIFNITTRSVPEAPSDLKTLGSTWDSIHLQWMAGFDGGYPQQFKVKFQEVGDDSSVVEETPEAAVLNITRYNVTGLKPTTTYKFTVFGLNILGAGQASLTITSQTTARRKKFSDAKGLDMPRLDEKDLVFLPASNQLTVRTHLPSTYCLKIQVLIAGNAWHMTHTCTGLDSVMLQQTGIKGVNVSVCLVSRPDVCGQPTAAAISNPGSKAILTERDVIIIAIVCAVIIVTLLIVLICFICRRRQANAKEYAEETASQPQPANGSVASKKPPVQTQTLPQVYNNIDSRYPAFPPSELDPPYWDMSARQVGCLEDTSFDSERERHTLELQLSRQNETIYGPADGLRNRQDAFSSSSMGLRGAGRDKYIDLEERQDPSLQSQESGYSTSDMGKPKKATFHLRLPGRHLSLRRRVWGRAQPRHHKHVQVRFSHTPPGHTCGLPCCQDDTQPSGRPRSTSTGAGPVSTAQNFTLRKRCLLPGRPSFSAKFFSLQTPGGARVAPRAGIPAFPDDCGVGSAQVTGGSLCQRESHDSLQLQQCCAAPERDPNSPSHPFPRIDPGRPVPDAPGRLLQPWERFRCRQMALPDTPGVSWCMVFLDFRPGESRDDNDEGEEVGRAVTPGPHNVAMESGVAQHDISDRSSARGSGFAGEEVRPLPRSPQQAGGARRTDGGCASNRLREDGAGLVQDSGTGCDDTRESLESAWDCQDMLSHMSGRDEIDDDYDNNSKDSCDDDSQFRGGAGDDVSEHVYDEVYEEVGVVHSLLQDRVAANNARNQWYLPEWLSLADVSPTSADLGTVDTGRKAFTPEMRRRVITPYGPENSTEDRYSTFPTRMRSKADHTYDELQHTSAPRARARPPLPPRRNPDGRVGGAGIAVSRSVRGQGLKDAAHDLTRPADDLTRPADDLTRPADDLTRPADDLTPPADDLTPPADVALGQDSPDGTATSRHAPEADSREGGVCTRPGVNGTFSGCAEIFRSTLADAETNSLEPEGRNTLPVARGTGTDHVTSQEFERLATALIRLQFLPEGPITLIL